jgi:hypothetical protein
VASSSALYGDRVGWNGGHKVLVSDYMYRKLEFLYVLRRICIEISDIVFRRNQPTAGQEALIQARACSAISKVR